MQPRRTKRAGWIETAWLVSVVLLFGALGLIRAGGSALPATTTTTTATTATDAQTAVAEQLTLVADAPAVTAYPPPYSPPPDFVPPTPEPTPRPEDPFMMGICIDGLSPSEIATWTETADVVVLGTVTTVKTPRWTTADGTRPANPRTDSEIIYTPIVVEVERYLKGEQPMLQLGVFARDGRIGQDRMDYCGDTRYIFGQGERVVLFMGVAKLMEIV